MPAFRVSLVPFLFLCGPLIAVVAAFACGGVVAPDSTSVPSRASPIAGVASTATASATAAPAWWESGTTTPRAAAPESRVWNVRAEAVSAGEVAVSFDYHLEIAPEANVFVHMGLLPAVAVTLIDAEGTALGSSFGELDPTEFGDDTVGGQGTFTVPATRFDDVDAVHFCIWVVTGNYDDFVGRTEVFCKPVPVERVELSPP